MKRRYTTFLFGTMALVVMCLLTGCATLRPPTMRVNKDLRAYSHVYVPATQTMDSHSGIPVAGVIIPYSQSVNPRDVIAGAFAKRGFVVLPSLDERFRTKTLMLSYGESGRRNVALGLGYAIEITIQLVSAETGELVATTTAEGCGSTEADDIKQAITRALDALFK